MQEQSSTIYPVAVVSINTSSLERLSPGFIPLVQRGLLSQNAVEVLQRAAIVNDATFNSNGKNATSTPHYDAYELEYTARYFNYTDACPELAIPDHPSRPAPIGKLICLALMLYCGNDLCPVPFLSTNRQSTRRALTADLLKYVYLYGDAEANTGHRREQNEQNEEEEQCLFWISIVTLNAWRSLTPGTTANGSIPLSSTTEPSSSAFRHGPGFELFTLCKFRFGWILALGYERCSATLKRYLRNPALDVTLLGLMSVR